MQGRTKTLRHGHFYHAFCCVSGNVTSAGTMCPTHADLVVCLVASTKLGNSSASACRCSLHSLASAVGFLLQRHGAGRMSGATLGPKWKPPRTVQILPWRVPGFSLDPLGLGWIQQPRSRWWLAVRLPNPMSPMVAGPQRGRGKSCKGLVAAAGDPGVN